MKPRPVLHHDEPTYPTRREFLAAAAAAAAAAGISGCSGDANVSTVVAPIFVHGDGRGSAGCVVVAPPVFLSEEEALQVIREELAKVGVTLGEGMPLADVKVEYEDPESRIAFANDDWLGDVPRSTVQPADLSALDRNRRVGVSYITTKDYDQYRGGVFSTVTSWNTRDLAQKVADSVREQARRDLYVGVFYDPMESWDFDDVASAKPDEEESESWKSRFDKVEAAAKRRSRDQLRKQVRDFVAWLQKNQ